MNHRHRDLQHLQGGVFMTETGSAESACGLPDHLRVLTLQSFFRQLQVIEVTLPVFRLGGFVHKVQIAEALIAVHSWH